MIKFRIFQATIGIHTGFRISNSYYQYDRLFSREFHIFRKIREPFNNFYVEIQSSVYALTRTKFRVSDEKKCESTGSENLTLLALTEEDTFRLSYLLML